MEIKVKRLIKTDKSTIGELSIDGKFECYTLEDKDRGLIKTQPLEEIKSTKIHSKTAIPTGRYKVILSLSNRFKKILPEILEVPGFAGIRIHSGNSDVDSEGCILLGKSKTKDWISESKLAMNSFQMKLSNVPKEEEIFITIE